MYLLQQDLDKIWVGRWNSNRILKKIDFSGWAMEMGE